MSARVRTAEPLRLMMTADAVGGVWTYAMDLARALAGHRVETVVAILGPPPDEAQRREAAAVPSLVLVETGLPLDWVAADPEALRQAARTLARLAGEARADIVQLHAAAFADAEYPVPVVAVHHSCLATWWQAVRGEAPMPPDFAWRTAATSAGLHAAGMLVAPSAAFATMTAAAYALEQSPLVVHNGRSSGHVDPAPDLAPFAFTAGRLWDEGKNVATLDRAAATLPVPVHAAGPLAGPNGASVDLASLQPLGSLCGEEVRRWLARRPIFVSPALYEPFGLAVLEAAQMGCALVLSDIPTFRELWGEAALFVPAREAEALSAGIRRLCDDGPLRGSLGRAARFRAQRYGCGPMAEGMLAAYRRLLGRPALEAAQ